MWAFYSSCHGYLHVFYYFIDYFSHYGYVERICAKSDAFEAFKSFKAKVELQKGKKIKIVNSNKGGEYYGRYDETRRNPRLFARYLQDYDIDVKYTMPRTHE